MIRFKKNKFQIIIILIIFSITACFEKTAELEWHYSDQDVVGTKLEKIDKIDVNIYVDATSSMKGYTSNSQSNYCIFLTQLQAYLTSAWAQTNIQYYKFGRKVFPIGGIDKRGDFLKSTSPSFYPASSDEIGEDITLIDNAIASAGNSNLNIIITDLFQNSKDATAMTESIKKKCLAHQIQFGILGIKSEYKGTVYDCDNCPYSLNSTSRPFYVMCFGHSYNMLHLLDAMKKMPFVKAEQFYIISENIMNSFSATLEKTRDSKYVNKKVSQKRPANAFSFSMKPEGTQAAFNLEINFSPAPYTSDFSENNLELLVYKKSVSKGNMTVPKDSSVSSDFTIENIKRVQNKLTATLRLKNEDSEGNYSYKILLKTNQLNGLKIPKWISDFSSANPSQSRDFDKTLNLDDMFVSKLLIANSAFSAPAVAKIYVNIYKH